jgi:NAD(P)-dependent dehydrogenase (short-subunit alcohol dehydrogenase family)
MQKKHLYILTGASRGMGLAMAQQLLSANNLLLCISRHANPDLAAQATQAGCALTQWSMDLAQATQAAQALTEWLQARTADEFASATLINNAGLIPALSALSQSDPLALSQALRVGLEAPMLLCASFLGATSSWTQPRKVLNISSGLGRRAMASQAAYCAAKAGMDHFTRCLALDEALQAHGAQVCSLAPGVIDTDMQLQLRQASDAAFPDQRSFIALKQQGQLLSPQAAASRVLAYLARNDFGQHAVADVRE